MLVASARSGLAVQRIVGQGEIVEVIWPFGYSATRDTSGLISLHDASGKEIAREGDVIILAGKGHEDYQVRGTTKYPFDERVVVRALKMATASSGGSQ